MVVKCNDRQFISFLCYCQSVFLGPSLFPDSSNETKSCFNQILKSYFDSLSFSGPQILLKNTVYLSN